VADSSSPERPGRARDVRQIAAAIETLTISGPPEIASQVVPAIRCARCGTRGVPMQAPACPNCGAGCGWAQIHPVVHITDSSQYDLTAAVRRHVALRGLAREA
jgi:hypothetical protein